MTHDDFSPEMGFEQALERLEAILAALEDGKLPLERAVVLFQEGVAMSKLAREHLDKAKLVVSQATADGVKPFAGEGGNDEECA